MEVEAALRKGARRPYAPLYDGFGPGACSALLSNNAHDKYRAFHGELVPYGVLERAMRQLTKEGRARKVKSRSWAIVD